ERRSGEVYCRRGAVHSAVGRIEPAHGLAVRGYERAGRLQPDRYHRARPGSPPGCSSLATAARSDWRSTVCRGVSGHVQLPVQHPESRARNGRLPVQRRHPFRRGGLGHWRVTARRDVDSLDTAQNRVRYPFRIDDEIDVEATPLEVWDAITVGPQIDSWLIG